MPSSGRGGMTAAERAKLAGIEAGAEVNVGEEYTTAEKSKLSGIEAGATADQSAAEIKSLYESNADTNEFSDAEQAAINDMSEETNGTKIDSNVGILTDPVANQPLSIKMASSADHIKIYDQTANEILYITAAGVLSVKKLYALSLLRLGGGLLFILPVSDDTPDATPQNVTLFAVYERRLYSYKITAVCRAKDESANGGWEFSGRVYRDVSGNATLLSAATKTADSGNTGGLDADIAVSGNNIVGVQTGPASQAYWTWVVEETIVYSY